MPKGTDLVISEKQAHYLIELLERLLEALEGQDADLLTPNDVAEITGGNVVAIRRQCARGDIPSQKIGSRWYIPRSVIEQPSNQN